MKITCHCGNFKAVCSLSPAHTEEQRESKLKRDRAYYTRLCCQSPHESARCTYEDAERLDAESGEPLGMHDRPVGVEYKTGEGNG